MLTVTRRWKTDISVQSVVSVDGVFQCYGLEPPQRDEKPRAIPAGIYQLTLRYSPKHGMSVPHVENVPGFSEIEIHVGNKPRDTEGCLLVGQIKGWNYVGNSKAAWDTLMSRLTFPTTITYEDDFETA